MWSAFACVLVCALILQSAAAKTPSIVVWTPFFEAERLHTFLVSRLQSEKCPVQCNIVPRSRMTTEEDFDAFIFHSRDADVKDVPRTRTNDQLYFIISIEAPGNREESKLDKFPPNFFNGTIGYSHLNNYTWDYDWPVEGKLNLTADFIHSKTDGVFGVISNCHSESGREAAVDGMRRAGIKMTLRGKCYDGKISDDEIGRQIKSHRFILALENKMCADYVTEKAYRYKELIVPIVFSRSLAEGVLPPDAFIALDDFNSTAELRERLERLQRDDEEYMKYFAWVNRPEYLGIRKPKGLCKLCTDLHASLRLHHSSLVRAAFPDENLCIVVPPRWGSSFDLTVLAIIALVATGGGRLVFLLYRHSLYPYRGYELVR